MMRSTSSPTHSLVSTASKAKTTNASLHTSVRNIQNLNSTGDSLKKYGQKETAYIITEHPSATQSGKRENYKSTSTSTRSAKHSNKNLKTKINLFHYTFALFVVSNTNAQYYHKCRFEE